MTHELEENDVCEIQSEHNWKEYNGHLCIIDEVSAPGGRSRTWNEHGVTLFTDGNCMAWLGRVDLKFRRKGTEEDRNAIAQRKADQKAQHRDLGYIMEHWGIIGPSSISIQYLFEQIGFRSYFEENGEFWVLLRDFVDRLEVFESAFKGAPIKTSRLVMIGVDLGMYLSFVKKCNKVKQGLKKEKADG